ncbi:MAG: hypothetical protein AAGC85_23150, partial [Bacteroidota bacterium]
MYKLARWKNIWTWIMGFCLLSPAYAQQPDLRLAIKRQNNFTFSTAFDLNYQREIGDYRFDGQTVKLLKQHHMLEDTDVVIFDVLGD